MNPSDLRVIIPVGGEAKRLKPLTAEVSKAVVRIFCRPIVEFAMAELANQGVRDFVFGVKGYVNYRSLFDYFGDGIGFSAQYGISPRIHIKYQPHIEDVGSADSVRVNLDYYDIKSPAMVVQGDNLFELDLADLLAFHEERQALMTVVLTPVEEVEGYGIADLGSDGRIRRFVEKPKREDAPSRQANTGIYLLSPQVRDLFDDRRVQAMIHERKRLDFGMDFIPFITENGYPIYGYILRGEWYDVGTPRGYLDTVSRVLKSGRTPFYFGEPAPNLGRVWIQGQSPESIGRRQEIIDKIRQCKVKLEGSVMVGRHCMIGDGAIIRDSCIDNFCIIGKDVTVERSALMDRALIGDGAHIQDSIIGRHVRINSRRERPTWVVDLCVIGDDVAVGVGCSMAAAKVFPHKTISDGSKVFRETIQ